MPNKTYKPMTEIVKVQRPMMTSDANTPWLIYDADRKRVTHPLSTDIPARVKDEMGGDFKAYFIGAWSSDTGWSLSGRVSDYQDF